MVTKSLDDIRIDFLEMTDLRMVLLRGSGTPLTTPFRRFQFPRMEHSSLLSVGVWNNLNIESRVENSWTNSW
jgi:hypothetical protein